MEPAQWRDYYCSEMYTFFCCDADRSRSIAERCVFKSTLMSWSQAQSHCRSLNKDLVTIYSQQENQQLQKLPGYVSGLSWIGMYHGKENWQWVSGKRASYANWKTQLSCATIGPDGYWTDVSCHELHPFMCYSEKRAVLRIELRQQNGQDPNDPAAKEFILKQVQGELSKRTPMGNTTLQWREQGGKVFHKGERDGQCETK
nr:PREDICTED: asialoglycoprotein receptor 2-like [Lepisosteus oculatus]